MHCVLAPGRLASLIPPPSVEFTSVQARRCVPILAWGMFRVSLIFHHASRMSGGSAAVAMRLPLHASAACMVEYGGSTLKCCLADSARRCLRFWPLSHPSCFAWYAADDQSKSADYALMRSHSCLKVVALVLFQRLYLSSNKCV
ncbi:hypothetical protein COEREDRAFT_7492 [Coemansia reversa NRRL 1564]|uniref:Uncharacterized protein n=1 Tax=Coemansia reversa (strain ATCC 12441 / NRRL 1564) TaxID=763665 RepID=A0A2G5BEV5_COERN|nr:hypothetical protein COEREDRAFT_7492 [Coemansia reversa NRRL 1564]|eukprot:PIA17531.1 hypothetical protein COEREDRAFT_7492 [Coemansia reversa NRRL 1564]